MIEKLMRLYVMAMAYDVRSPMPHLVGPPGCGKSTFVEQLADLLDVELHIINVSRLSPLDVEGIQMPHGSGEDMALRMLPAIFWTSLKEGDILLMDEFLRGFPEVYNALLDIFTSRRAGAFRLPKVFIIGASNSVIAYDHALEDRLLHLPVPDPRRLRSERKRMAQVLVDELGLEPTIVDSAVMEDLLDSEVLPMYNLLDSFKKNSSGQNVTTGESSDGHSLRNLIGQVKLRMITSSHLKDLIAESNRRAIGKRKYQYVLLLGAPGEIDVQVYAQQALKLRGNPHLTRIQEINLECNLQLIELSETKKDEEA